jgi:YD repeat-containing protein
MNIKASAKASGPTHFKIHHVLLMSLPKILMRAIPFVPALLLAFAGMAPVVRAECGSSCTDAGLVDIEFRASAFIKNGGLSVGLTGGPTQSVPGPDPADVVSTPPDVVAHAKKNEKISGSASASSDLLPNGCYTVLRVVLNPVGCSAGTRIEVRSRRGDEPQFSEWTETKTIVRLLNTTVSGGITIDYEVRLIEDKDTDDKETEEPEDDEEGGTQTGGGTATIPTTSQDTPPGGSGQPASVTPVSFYSEADLGPGAGGDNAGSIRLSGPLSSSLADGSNLELSDPGVEELWAAYDSEDGCQQVFTSLHLIDIQPVFGGGVELKYYKEGDFTPPTETTTLCSINSGASPFKTIRYLPLAAVSGQHLGGIRVVTIGMRGTTYTKDVVSTGSDGQSYRIIEESGLRTTDVVSTFEYSSGYWHRNDLVTEKREGLLYSKTLKKSRYQVRRNGGGQVTASRLFLLESSEYVDETTSLTTSYVPDSTYFGRVQSVTRPDGSWTRYTYYSGTETGAIPEWKGMIKEIFRPWNGSPASPGTAIASNSECTTIVYALEPSSYGYEEESRITTLPGPSGAVMVRKSAKTTPFPTSALLAVLEEAGMDTAWLPDASQVEDEAEETFASANDAAYRSSFTYRYPSSDPNFPWNGSSCATVDDLGSGTVTGYQLGTYNTGTGSFTVDTTGTGTSSTHIQRIDVEMRAGDLTPSESTKEVTISDLKGKPLRRELWIYDATSAWSLASTTTFEYPTLWVDGSVREVIEKKDTRIVRRVYQTSGTELHEWDEQGIETVSVADLIGRTTAVTTVGISGGQPDRIAATSYSGRTTVSTMSGGGLAVSTSRTSDLLGRTLASFGSNGAKTTYTYPNGGRDVSTFFLNPNDPIRSETRNIEGRTVSVAGPSVVDEVYLYSVLSSGNITTKVMTGDLANSPRYTITETDWAGRTVKVTTPSPTGTGEVSTTYAYEPGLSVLASVTSPAGTVLRQQANFASTLVISGQEDPSDSDAILTTNGSDRVTETREYYLQEGGYWWVVSSSKRYDAIGSSATAVTAVTKTCLHGLPGGDAARTIRTAPTGETMTSVITIDRANKTLVTTETTSGVTNTAVTTNVNGLTVSLKGRDVTTPFAYLHDGLGRVVREVSPRGEITVRTYHADGSLATVTDHGNKTTSYAYYGPLHASSGKLSALTDPLGKTRTYAYSPLGKVSEEGGSAAYKVTYEYDAYGVKNKMFTWRNATTSDVTEWVYQPGTGLLQSKKDATNAAVTYTYFASGRIDRRTWARGITTDYGYNSFGDLTGINYSDSTPDVTIGGHDRPARQERPAIPLLQRRHRLRPHPPQAASRSRGAL